MEKYVGIIVDELTPEIGARILQDTIAMLTITGLYGLDLVLCTAESRIEKLLSTLPVKFSTDMTKPKLCVSYKAGEEYGETPDQCTTLVTRDFYQTVKDAKLDLTPRSGHPLKNFRDRISYSNMNRIWNHPNGYAPPDAAMIMLWGPVKG